MIHSSGLVMYRLSKGDVEVLLVHPSGNYNRRAPWSIPKGVPADGESLQDAAVRETWEESAVQANVTQSSALVSLGFIDYRRSRKRVHAFAVAAPSNAAPHPASWEVDRAAFLPLEEARRVIHPDQLPLLDRLEEMLGKGPACGE